MAKDILFIPHNHFDPTWRRCFDRPAEKHGVVVRSYAELEERIINTWLELAPRGYTFTEGQAAVWRKYLQRNPDRRETLRQLADSGLLDVVLAGETVQDSVMPSAEGLVRNFLVAMPFYRELVGEDHPGLKLAWLEDAFGNSPNYPQVLKGVGAEVACLTCYRPCPEDIWVGIDGSRIYCIDHMPSSTAGCWVYHPPCPACKGKGCRECSETGMKMTGKFFLDGVRAGLKKAMQREGEWLQLRCSSEEGLPEPGFVDLLEELDRDHDGTIRFAVMSDAYQRHLPALRASDAKRDDQPTEDLNPAMPGCMVTRIKIKQRVRAVSYKLTAAEAALANAAWATGQPQQQPQELTDAWQRVAFCQFHDAITGTHIDSAYTELMDMLDEAEQAACRHVDRPADDEPAQDFVPAPALPTTMRMGELDVTYDLEGILSIERGGVNVFRSEPGADGLRRPLRVAELTIEEDIGDAWGKRYPEGAGIYWDSSLIYLGAYHDAVSATPNSIRWHGIYTGGDPKVSRLEWTVTATGSADGRLVEFVTNVLWDTGSRRLRMVIPVDAKDRTAIYEVPFGFIPRTFDPDKINHERSKIDTQEFPTLHWVCKQTGDQTGVVLFNKGLPCHRWTPENLDLSLLRSPESCFSANMPLHYEFWDLDGQRDAGEHRFEYAIMPYIDGFKPGDLTRHGYSYNLPAPVDPPFEVEGDIVVTAWKPAENGTGWILRVQEASGQGTEITLTFDDEREVTVTNLLEQPRGDPERTCCYTTSLHKHGILTVLLQ